MEFRNDKHQSISVRIPEEDGYKWELARPGQIVDVPEEAGRTYGLKPVEEPEESEPEKEEEPEPEEEEKSEQDNWKEEIEEIDGVGPKTAKDIIEVYPDKESLLMDIEEKDHLPVRNDVEDKLKEKFS